MVLMGVGLVGGALETLVGSTLTPLDEQIGTHGSAAAAVLGVGLIFAALNPTGHIIWVRLGIVYGFVVLVFEAGSSLLYHKTFHLGPVIFGLAFSLLLIATYPEGKRLTPTVASPAIDTEPVAAPEKTTESDAAKAPEKTA